MPSRLMGNKMVAGVQTVSTVNAAPIFSAWVMQSDQNYVKRWYPPVYDPFEYAVYGTYEDGSQRGHGFLSSQWRFSYWTFGQLIYWRDQMLSGSAQYGTVTVLNYTDENIAQYIVCKVYNPTQKKGTLAPLPGGWSVTLNMDYGYIIT